MNFPQWPCFAEKTLNDIQMPLLSGQVNYWTGKKGMEFENKFADWIGAEMAISCNSGTSAVNIAVGALNIGPGDEVIVPSYTFIATSFAVLQCGAIPIFCDTTEEHTIDPNKIEALITSRTKAIIVVHLYGVVCDMDPIMAIARKHNLKVIEDSAQCLGGKYKGKSVGTMGDLGTFSFCQSKHFTTGGEGGMVVTNNTEIGWECRAYRDHGFDVRRKFDLLALEEVSWHVHNRIGYNYRMTEIQSIIGINELERFDNWNMKNRQQYAKIYDEKFANIDLIGSLPLNSEDRCNAYWLYPIVFDLHKLDCTAEVILSDLKKIGVPAFKIQWPEAYGEKVFKELRGFGSVNFPFHSTEYTSPESVNYLDVVCETARSLLPRTISLYLHPSWDEKHIVYCADQLIAVLNNHRIG
ncbi:MULTISPECIES: DegT/DnrJ/EryC1/StrS family aminotransferase [Xenorhabdus]|uniref:DegT/DnrJ/EryC1/StrS family aminotransferase n=1 Tax=Xenorhabdus TaxID=626 RepID=UPI00064AF675|nr:MULTISPECIES: DegT/DnrJ/EryC1/StrS family aminotransferase [Xenorhabdus]KLU14832.1 aminotransferase DegT [Xenorhabdus griffiniae]KOP32999.1 aminotransferase DegT [Xenorhabdus sp. GDc328]WFQ81187.1 DegT/DnrJ/EryC1/StrS family aminotransferase [Xenorhabdus sp. SF857]